MKRFQEKVKDLIEVRNYEHLQDFLVEPEKTLANYHYTPVTSELMANWLDAVVGVGQNNGVAKALAGYRGVGKSHFLATLGAILAYPELRSEIDDSHVASGVHHLRRRHYPIAFVRRGTKKSFIEELKAGVASALEIEVSELSDDTEVLVKFAAEKAGELPFVIIVDTDIERESRVSRDDGGLLGKLAEVAKKYNVFIGVALDDDITDADGINSAIAQTYTIDYLDQEHLYQIVNTHIFPKHRQTRMLIQELYHEFRSTFPNFRWSEQRFNSLYPLHPSILEVAPYVRIYASDFALLGFASAAGRRILGRPANSLISLDEVFDNVENTLRKSAELKDSFEIYDKIGKEVISQIPIMERLQAKLILKALFILSLDGDGTSAGEISEAMLIYEEGDSLSSAGTVRDLLEKFAVSFPNDVLQKIEEDGEVRYSLRVSGKDELNSALNEAAKDVGDEVIPAVFRRIANDRFSDWNLFADVSEAKTGWSEYKFLWRGGLRHVRLFWNWDYEYVNPDQQPNDSELFEFDIFINSAEQDNDLHESDVGVPKAIWQTAELQSDEIDTIRRLYILLNDTNLKDQFGEQVRAAGHKHIAAVEKIWNRIFLKDAAFVVDGKEYRFIDDTTNSDTVSEALSSILSPVLEEYYPEHPIFISPLGMEEVSTLVNELFSGARGNVAAVQGLARNFALPLGLVSKQDEDYRLEGEKKLSKLPLVNELLDFLEKGDGASVTLRTVYKQLKRRPYGLVQEAQHLILAALVARRKIEFVTTRGDRINHHSLDLKIDWNDIDGIAKPESVDFNYEKLIHWAEILSPLEGVESLEKADERRKVREALSAWQENWLSSRVMERFSELPDEILNTSVWYISVRVEKAFGEVSNIIQSVLDEQVQLDAGLQRIADTFLESEDEFNKCKNDLTKLEDFIDGAKKRENIWSYLAICDLTNDKEIEAKREDLLRLIDETYAVPDSKTNLEMQDLWEEFHAAYTEHFVVRHNAIMNSRQLKKEFDEIQKSDEWWEFESLSKLPIFKELHWKKTQKLLKQFHSLECCFDVRENLKIQPFCSCAFNLAQMGELAKLAKSFAQAMKSGRFAYRKTLHLMNAFVAEIIEENVLLKQNKKLKDEAEKLVAILTADESESLLSNDQLSILHLVLDEGFQSTTIEVALPKQNKIFTSEELRESLNAWVDELPNDSVLLKV